MKALLIDIGNSRIKGRSIDTHATTSIDLSPVPLERIDQLANLWPAHIAAATEMAFVSNVASADAEASIVRWLHATVPAIRIERVVPEQATAGVVNGYRHPARLGPDRWMALVGAHALYPDRSLLVCGFGTATTLDLLRKDGDDEATFVGGLILPGIDAMRVALLERTARLGVPAGAVVDFADNTEDAISSGVLVAQVGALREAWRRARSRTSPRLECVLSGGASRAVLEAFDQGDIVMHHVPDLVIRGLAVLAEKGSASADGPNIGLARSRSDA